MGNAFFPVTAVIQVPAVEVQHYFAPSASPPARFLAAAFFFARVSMSWHNHIPLPLDRSVSVS